MSDADVEEGPAEHGSGESSRFGLRSLAELFALSGIAIAQPLLDLLSKNTGIFIAHNTTGFQAVVLVLLILFAVPLAAWLVEIVVARVWPWSRRWVHAAEAGVLISILALEVVKKQTSLHAAQIIAAAVVAGVAGALLMLLVPLVRQFLHVLAIAPLVFALLFLAASPATDVVFHSGATATVSHGATHPHRVVFVLLDELPEMSLLDGTGHVDSQLFPNFAAFEADSTWYRNETTVAPYTDFAVPAILTGKYPKKPTDLPTVADYPDNLFTMLRGAYAMNVHESVTRMCPSSVCKFASGGAGFGSLLSQTAGLWKDYASPKRFKFSFADDAGVGIALPTMQTFLSSLQRTKSAQLDFVHVVFPHNPWHYLPTLQDTTITRLPGAEKLAWGNQPLADVGRQRHLLQLQAADVLLGRVLARLKTIDAYRDSMVVVTGDHGVAFTNQQPMRAVSKVNAPQIMWPPLFIKYPNETKGTIDDRPALTVDILPTIADVIGLKVPYPIDGRSLLGAPRTSDTRPFYQWKIPGGFGVPGGLVAQAPDSLSFDGVAGFREVLRARAAPPGPDPSLRIYRTGDFGKLVGRSVSGLVNDQPNTVTADVGTIRTLDNIRLRSAKAPWAYQDGSIRDANGSMEIALGISGRIVAVASADPYTKTARNAFFSSVVPPELVHAGRNVLTVYIVRGTASHPTFDPIPIKGS